MTKSTKVGTDLDTPDTVRTSIARETMLYLARVYKKTYYPKPLELEFEVDEVVVEVKVRTKDRREKREKAEIERRLEQYSYE